MGEIKDFIRFPLAGEEQKQRLAFDLGGKPAVTGGGVGCILIVPLQKQLAQRILSRQGAGQRNLFKPFSGQVFFKLRVANILGD